jgi:hypothetical protein
VDVVKHFNEVISYFFPNKKLVKDEGELFEDPSRYRRLVGKLNYLTIITRPDISYTVSVVSQFLEAH